MTPKDSLAHDYGRLARFLRGLSSRFQFIVTLESLLLLASGFMVVLLGSLFTRTLGEAAPYLPFVYCIISILFSFGLLTLGLWRAVRRPSLERTARALETKHPHLRDDVTNSLLLYAQIEKEPQAGQISASLISAQIRKTATEVSELSPWKVVSFQGIRRTLRFFVPLVVTFGLALILDPHFLNRSLALILHPFSALPVKETFISVDPKGSIVLRGSQVVIRAQTSGDFPERLTLALWPDRGEMMRFSMETEGNGRFAHRIVSAQFTFRYQAYNGRAASPIYRMRVVDPPEVGGLRLTLLPPGYTGLSKEVREDGQIEALKGTLVNLEAQTTKGVTEGKIVLNEGNQLLLDIGEKRLAGSLLVLQPGSYSIRVKDELGFENPNPVLYPIRIIADQYPEAEIIRPAKDLEIIGNEIIPVAFTAKDDFGVTSVKLSYRIGGKEQALRLKSPGGSRSVGPETFQWDLASLDLASGDRVVYRLEVEDNDSVSGPKVAYSRSFTFSVRDERSRAEKAGMEAQQITDALLDLLADQLEGTKDEASLGKGMEEVLSRVDRSLEEMGDKVERFDLEALRRNLSYLKERLPRESKETVTQEMERLALLAEDIAKKARMKELEALAREIRNRERRLIEALKEHKGPLAPEALSEFMKELKKLEELLHSVMEALGKMATRLPEEFVNSQDLSGMDFQDLFKDLDEIRDRLMSGDLAGALEAAQRLLQALSEMMAALGRAGAQAGMSSMDRMQGEMSRQSGELDKILAEQKAILSETERIEKTLKRLAEEEMEKRWKASLPQIGEALEGLTGALSAEQKEMVEGWEDLLKRGQLDRFSRVLRDMERDLPGTPEAHRRLRELKEKVDALTSRSEDALSPDEREKFPGLSSREDALKERTKGLRERLEMLAQLFPGLDTQVLDDLREAAGSMGDAAQRLAGEDAPGAIPPEQDALRKLSRSQQAMQQMSQQMAQQMAMMMNSSRWGYPWGYDPRPGWYYGPWIPMPTLPQPEVKRPAEKGLTGFDREEFDPPSKDAYQAPKVFREKVMEALKEGAPPQYRREVERYFRGLSE